MARFHSFYVVVQLLSHIWLCNPTDCSMSGFPVLHRLLSLLKLMCIESMMPSNHLILCHPLLLLPSVFPSIRVFFNESDLYIRWPKYWSFSFSISSSSEYSGLISFMTDWFDFLAVQGTLMIFSSTTIWRHHFFGAQPPLWSNPTSINDYWKNHSFDYMDLWRQSDVSAF